MYKKNSDVNFSKVKGRGCLKNEEINLKIEHKQSLFLYLDSPWQHF